MVGLAAITGPSRSQTRLHHAIASYKLDRRPGDNTILRMAGLEEACLQVSADNYCRTKPGNSSPTPKPRRVDRRPASAAEIAWRWQPEAELDNARSPPVQRAPPIGIFSESAPRVGSHTNQKQGSLEVLSYVRGLLLVLAPILALDASRNTNAPLLSGSTQHASYVYLQADQ